jgi:hypothetical protein
MNLKLSIQMLLMLLVSTSWATADPVNRYDVVWNELGHSSADSMPIGNGDIGLNVWTEQNGDLCFYIGKTDAWSEDNKGPWGLMKLGKIRVSLNPNPFTNGPIMQALRLHDGFIEVRGGQAAVRVCVDANRPVIIVQCDSPTPVEMTVAYETWRTKARGNYSADVTVPDTKNRVIWYHHNTKASDPRLKDWTFGAAIAGDGFVSANATTLHSATPAAHQSINIYPLTVHPSSTAEWQSQLESLVATCQKVDAQQAWADHLQWWHAFWQRSWIFADGDDSAVNTTNGYVLQRFVTACAGRGAFPIKFNGSLFVVDRTHMEDGVDKVTRQKKFIDTSPDYRRWGGQYWFQNTRAMYWPRLMAGDFDMMLPLFHMYQAMVPNNTRQVKSYFGFDGLYFCETAPFYGDVRDLVPTAGTYTDHYFTPILELSAMMLDYFDYTQDESFLHQTLLPIADGGLSFFDHHFKQDQNGKLLLEPDNAIEMYWRVSNPAPDIAGLHYVTQRLLDLPERLTTPQERSAWKKLQDELPDLPRGTREKKDVLLPYTGEQTAKPENGENPELYAVYPFRLFGLGKPELQLAKDTFDARRCKGTGCWVQDPIQAAYLGMTTLAKEDVIINLTRGEKNSKFPAFWDQGHDYDPDEDNGGNGENALQKMLMQCDGRKILLLPAWPHEWNVSFKLNAPLQTTIQGTVRDGKLIDMKVLPESRRTDVVIADQK